MASLQQINKFIDLIASAVIAQCKNHGWGVPSAIIAQAGLESAWGTSGLWLSCYNGWGMKWKDGCGTDYKEYSTKEQRTDGTYYTVVAKFRKYPDVLSGINGYFDFIESYKRYVPVKAAKDYVAYASQLKACGWATSIQYANNIINTVIKYGLTKYDTMTVSNYIVGMSYTTVSDLNIRDSAAGTKVKYECITEDGKRHSKFDEYGNAILLKGTNVTCKETKKLNTSTWMHIPSGWICAKTGNIVYIPV